MNLRCPSCNTDLTGRYCSNCGEKKIESKDFSIPNLVGEGFSFFTNLDSKLYQTIIGLLFKPGFLAQEYIAGRRVNYMKPFQVFVLSSILFYIFLSEIDLFLIPSKWFFSDYTADMVSVAMVKYDASNDMIAQKYDGAVVSNSKLYIFVLLPIIGLLLYMFNFKKIKEFGKYIIHAIYILSFFMVITVTITEVTSLLFSATNKWMFIIPLQVLFVTYIIVTLKRTFKIPWWYSALQGLVITFFLGFFIGAYRYGISYYTLSTL